MEIAVSDRAVIDWESFSIRGHEVTRFLQSNSGAAVLNRVTGGSISELNGLLISNGRVYLMNPQGVVIGPNGRIDTAGFIATTLEIRPEEFVRDLEYCLEGGSFAEIKNLGVIQSSDGPVALVAHRVVNEGTIVAEEGTCALIAGHELLLKYDGNSLVMVRPEGSGSVISTGDIQALEARISSEGTMAQAIQLKGTVQASTLAEEGGRIYLRADFGGVDIEGHLIASGTKGGLVAIAGESIALRSSSIDVSGAEGAGEVHIGTYEPGRSVHGLNAVRVDISADTTITADSYNRGDGGKIVIFSDDQTRFLGAISAQAFGKSGNGGVVEISGREMLYSPGFSDLRAAHGAIGHLIHDPPTIVIQPGADMPPVGNTYNDGYISAQLGMANFTLTNAPTAGTITFDVSGGAIAITWSAATTFQLLASSVIADGTNSVTITSNATATTPFYAVDFRANTGNGVPPETGNFNGINLTSVVIDASGGSGAGGIHLEGQGGDTGNNNVGVYLSSCDLETFSGVIELDGTGGGGAAGSGNLGVRVISTDFITQSGAVTIDGTASATPTGTGNAGVALDSGTLTSSATAGGGTISITGQGGVSATGSSHGVNYGFFNTTTGSGSVSMTGYAGGSGSASYGIYARGGSVTGTNGASVTLMGVGPTSQPGGAGSSTGTNSGYGIFNQGTDITLDTGTIRYTGVGKGTGSNNSGIGNFMMSGLLETTAGGSIVMNGRGSLEATGTDNHGVTFTSNIFPVVQTSTGSITIEGVGGTGSSSCFGVDFPSTMGGAMNGPVFSADGNILMAGTSTNGNSAVAFGNGNGPYTTGAGSITITATNGNLQIGGSPSFVTTRIATYGSGNLTLSTVNGSIVVGDSAGQDVFVQSVGTGTLVMNSDQSLQVINAEVTSASTGAITLQAAQNIVLGNDSTIAGTNGNVLLIAGANIVATGTVALQTTGPTAQLTLVADNAYPNPFGISGGLLSFASTTTFSSSKVNFFAGPPGTSSFPSTINGLAYTPGSFSGSTYVPGTNEQLGYWYQTLPPPALPTFQISYKQVPPPTPPAQTVVIEVTVATTQSTVVPGQVNTQTLTTVMTSGTANLDPHNTCTAPSVSVGL
jgi:filamentous hemagglutinin family protein